MLFFLLPSWQLKNKIKWISLHKFKNSYFTSITYHNIPLMVTSIMKKWKKVIVWKINLRPMNTTDLCHLGQFHIEPCLNFHRTLSQFSITSKEEMLVSFSSFEGGVSKENQVQFQAHTIPCKLRSWTSLAGQHKVYPSHQML